MKQARLEIGDAESAFDELRQHCCNDCLVKRCERDWIQCKTLNEIQLLMEDTHVH